MAKKTTPEEMSVYSYSSSLQFIKDFIDSKGHGFKAAVSKATGCQSAYVSRVLSEKAHFNLEQAERLTQLFLLSDSEAHFFLTLVQRDRASTKELKNYFNKILDDLREARLDIKTRVKVSSEINENDRHIYYSSWLYGAVYVMTSIAKYQSIENIASALSVPPKKVLEILKFLVSIGLVKHEKGKYVISSGSLHLGKDNPHITQHHMNWRMRALASVEVNKPEDLHYSLVMSLSRVDSNLIKEKLVDLIEEINKLLAPSKEEDVQILCIDLFGL